VQREDYYSKYFSEYKQFVSFYLLVYLMPLIQLNVKSETIMDAELEHVGRRFLWCNLPKFV
jgi:hypothetical protein